ncbi:MAG: hypothetical protein FJW20_16755 [Acidimicrobiia bacterium]|nr:hypothetical protein [Acidimicrobiia bacterium]
MNPRRGIVLGLVVLAMATWLAQAGRTQTPEEFFDDLVLHEVRLYLHPVDWRKLQENFEDNTYYPGEFVWRGRSVVNVGIRSRGGGSRSDFKPGLKIDFKRYIAGQRFVGETSFVLDNHIQDATFMRERLTMALFRRAGIPAPRTAFAKVFINDSYWGLYSIVEEIEKPFLKRSLGEDIGWLYEYNWLTDYNFEFLGFDDELYGLMWDPKTRENNADVRTILEFIQMVNEVPDEEFLERVGEHLDLESLMRYLAVENYVSEWDGIVGSSGMNNFYLYRYNNTKRFQLIPWDKDVGLTNFDHSILFNLDRNVLTRRAMQFPELARKYLDEVQQIAELAGGPDGWLQGEFEFAYRQIRQAVFEDRNKPLTNSFFDHSAEAMREFIQYRPTAIGEQMDELSNGPRP